MENEGNALELRGSAQDPEDGLLSGSSLAWSSSVDGPIGTGGVVDVASASYGEHTITLTATDSKGATATASVTVTVDALPSATITGPADGSSFDPTDAIRLEGEGADREDGALSGTQLVWSSNSDGVIGSGSPLTVTDLSTGVHEISMTVTDSNDGVAVAEISLEIYPPSGGGGPSDSLEPIALMDMTAVTYRGFMGGLYPAGSAAPSSHVAEGVSRANRISGTSVLLSLGMSNTSLHFADFIERFNSDPTVSSNVVAVNGAQPGHEASDWENPDSPAYSVVQQRLSNAGVQRTDVDALWVLHANHRPTISLPSANADAYELVRRLGNSLRAATVRYPNARVAFVSSRIHSCAIAGGGPEPYAYESGFAVKWLIAAQINQIATGVVDPLAGDLDYRTGVVPWIAWGPYLWADGANARSDGLRWVRADFQADCTHPSPLGTAKVATRLLDFFKTMPFTRPWFMP